MHTIEQLVSGELANHQRIQIQAQLTEFPSELFTHAPNVEILDLSGNKLTSLPNELSQLTRLHTLFVSNNQFDHLPNVLGQCENLQMIGFKSNRIKQISAESIPKKLRWLILTDNHIEQLPDSLGECKQLQKLMMAGNQLTQVPKTLTHCKNLQLIRLSANNLIEFPTHLLELPKLAWLAYAGNPFCQSPAIDKVIPSVSLLNITIKEQLGTGASGIISKARFKNEDVAVKVFKGAVTSDGYPDDELMATLRAGSHKNLIQPLAQLNDQQSKGLVMELIPAGFTNLGQPPSLKSCTRDTFKLEQKLSIGSITHIVEQMTSVCEHLASIQLCHGDIYAHNVLVDDTANVIFSDFGAASSYHYLPKQQQEALNKIETRALGFFIEDLLSICKDSELKSTQYDELAMRAKHYIA